MNKWQIICPLATIAIAAMVVIAVLSRSMNRDITRMAVYQIGRELAATTHSARLVRLEPELKARLTGFFRSTSGVEAVKFGDAPLPIGNGRATIRLFLTNASGERLGIRLRRDRKRGQFRVVGFWEGDEGHAPTQHR